MALPGAKALKTVNNATAIIPKPTARCWFMTMIVGERTGPVYKQHSERGLGSVQPGDDRAKFIAGCPPRTNRHTISSSSSQATPIAALLADVLLRLVLGGATGQGSATHDPLHLATRATKRTHRWWPV
jgi:hypothetical protein